MKKGLVAIENIVVAVCCDVDRQASAPSATQQLSDSTPASAAGTHWRSLRA
ncbi:hypothetical protein BLL52_2523 [Rhodoferax antarcticus ANT.BR]|uniref:Uncharacterized protein n=1 Tax=Rhodoferax antarcticus ANT.BR TaxID=1111071 RepID=A0A1Q8YE93_9BURK|nr:hypothetical protein BLL52_2523 [Rhodoferax antarcticus ANT.BR]